MIKTLILKNFGKHKHLHIDFSDKINVIIGQTNVGKSTIFKAINLVFNNKPANSKKIYNHKQKENYMVSVIIKNFRIDRTYNKYVVTNLDTNESQEYSAFGSGVPQPVIDILNLSEINYQKQMSQYYLILDSPGQRTKSLAPIIGLDDSNKIIDNIKTKINSTKSSLKEFKRRKVTLIQDKDRLGKSKMFLARLNSLKFKNDSLSTMNRKLSDICDLLEEISNLKTVDISKVSEYITRCNELSLVKNEIKSLSKELERIKRIAKELNVIKSIKPVQEISTYIRVINTLINIRNEIKKDEYLYKSVSKLMKSIKNTNLEMDSLSEEIDKWTKLFHSKIKGKEKCPLCNQAIHV